MTPEEKLAAEKAARDAFTAYVRKCCTDGGVTVPTGKTFETMTAEECVDQMRSEIGRLKPLADDGTKLRTRLVDEVVVEGKRALGDKFAEEAQRAKLGRLTVDDLITERDGYKVIADEKFGGEKGGGRKSTEEADDDPTKTAAPASSLPDEAFASA